MLEDILIQNGYREVNAREVYSDLYHFGEDYIQREGQLEPGLFEHFNPLVWAGDQKIEDDETTGQKVFRGKYQNHYKQIILQDNLDKVLTELQSRDMGLCMACGYYGKNNLRKMKVDKNGVMIPGKNPQTLFGFIIDLDEVKDSNLRALISQMTNEDIKKELAPPPRPNYISCSGGGLHLYYVLTEPYRLDARIKIEEMNYLKGLITELIWNQYTSEKSTEQQSIVQGYRVIGGKTKPENREIRPTVRAFQVRKDRYSLAELKSYVALGNFDFIFRDYRNEMNKHSREWWKEHNKEWFQRRIIEKQAPGWYTLNKSVYADWLKEIRKQGNYGHRYNAIKTLAITALQCDIPFEQVKQDAYDLVPALSALSPDHPFEYYEADQALQAYFDERNHRVQMRTKLKLAHIVKEPKKKRNPPEKRISRKSALKLANLKKQILKEQGTYSENGGRKENETREVLRYLADNDYLSVKTEAEFDKKIRGKITGIAKETGVSRPTVYKAIKIVKWFNKWIEDEAISQEEIANRLMFSKEMLLYLKDEGVIDNALKPTKPLNFSSLSEEHKRTFLELSIKYKQDIYGLWIKHF